MNEKILEKKMLKIFENNTKIVNMIESQNQIIFNM